MQINKLSQKLSKIIKFWDLREAREVVCLSLVGRVTGLYWLWLYFLPAMINAYKLFKNLNSIQFNTTVVMLLCHITVEIPFKIIDQLATNNDMQIEKVVHTLPVDSQVIKRSSIDVCRCQGTAGEGHMVWRSQDEDPTTEGQQKLNLTLFRNGKLPLPRAIWTNMWSFFGREGV